MFKSIATLNKLSISYLVGVICGLYFINDFSIFILFFALSVVSVLAIVFRKDKSAVSFFIIVIVLLISIFRTISVKKGDLLVGQQTLRGYISEAPLFLENTQTFNFKSNKGSVLVITERYKEYSYGDNLEVSGNFKVARGKNEVGFPRIVKLGGSSGYYGFDLVFNLRDRFKSVLANILPEPEGSLAFGMLLGSSSVTDKNFLESLRKTGTSHIISVSGFNISIIIVGLIIALNLVPTKIFIIPIMLIVILFDIMVGFTAPVLRATIMGIFILLAKILGRQQNITDALLLSAALISVFDPLSLKTPSFQLSFFATAGIIYLFPYIMKAFRGLPSYISNDISVSLSAQIAVLPIVIYHFGVLSLISPVANLLVAWTIIPIMVFTFVAGFLGLFYLPFGQVIGALDLVVLTYFVKVITFLASIPWSVINL